MKARALWLGASALAFAWCGSAMAQTAAPADSDTAASSSDEVIVTATRRSENLMTSSISATVISGQDLANKGVVNVDALQFAMPSVVVNNFGQGNDFNVRGIGKAEHNTQTTTGVITYRDGVPSFPGYFQAEPYYDVNNIQVLRGPQGTIVGQNATGGAVFVNTNDPIIGGGFHGYVNANYGNYNDAGAQGALNIPVSDTFAARVAFYGERRDSFFNITGPGGAAYPYNKGELRQIAGRISFLWKPSDRFSILSKTDLDYLDQGAYPAKPFAAPGDLFDLSYNSPQGARDKFVRSILKVNYELAGGIKFHSITSFQTGNTNYRADLDGTSTANSTFFDSVTETQVSQEFNLVSPDDQRLTWLVGGFGLWNSYFFLAPYQFVIDTGTPQGVLANQYKLQGRNPERSLAAFGQIGFKITPSLKLELGGRYTSSRTTNHVDILQNGLALRDDQRAETHNFSYKAALGWQVNRNNYLYGFVATGFRPGGLNVPVGFGVNPPFEPERVQSYEAGWKANFAGGRVRTTIDAFYNNYKNFQIIIGYPAVPVFGIEVSVPNATKIYGFEAETEVKLGHFGFDAGINVLHSELGQFYATDPRIPAFGACSPTTGPASTSCINLKGREQTYAPNFTFNVGASYEFEIGNGDKITPRVNYGHIAPQWATLFENTARGDRLGERNIVNAQLGWQHGTIAVTGYATNLLNRHYVGALNTGLYFPGPPRQYGVKVLKTF